jgi:hypothetical protein
MRIRLTYRGEERQAGFDLEGLDGRREVILGRGTLDGQAPDLDLEPDQAVSRRHARIVVADGDYWIEDLRSKRGTYLGGRRIEGRERLRAGVEVRIGNTVLERVDEGAGSPAKLRASVDCLPAFNFSLAHAGVPFLRRLTLSNPGVPLAGGGELQVLVPGYLELPAVPLPPLGPGACLDVALPGRWLFNAFLLRDLPDPDNVGLEVWADRERIPIEPPIQVEVLPANAWYFPDHHHALAGFVLPASDAVNEVAYRARFELRRQLAGAQSFSDARESADPKAVEKTMKAFYYCLQQQYAIAYDYEPRNYARDWQKVRFPHAVLGELRGTCIDLALLLAACLENAHRDPVVIVVRTGASVQHALVGCWTGESPGAGVVFHDEDQLRGWVKAGRLLVLDPMGLAATGALPTGLSFPRSRQSGADYVKDCPLAFALDLVAAREAGVTPMPLPFGKGVQYDQRAWLALFRGRREAEQRRSPQLGARHLLLGLLSLDEGLLRQVLDRDGPGRVDRLLKYTRDHLPRVPTPRSPLPESEGWKAAVGRAEAVAATEAGRLVSEAHLVAALLRTSTHLDRILESEGFTRSQCLELLDQLLARGPAEPSHWLSSGLTA